MQTITHVIMYRVARDTGGERQGFKVVSFVPEMGEQGVIGFWSSTPPYDFIAKKESCELLLKIKQDAGDSEFAHAYVEQAYYGPSQQAPTIACPKCKRFVWLPEFLMTWTCLHCGHMMLVKGKAQ